MPSARVAPPDLSSVVGEITGGNPLFVGETLRHIKESGAIGRLQGKGADFDVAELGLLDGVKEVIGRRLSRMSEPCNRVLTLAAVVGREFDVAGLEALGDVPDDQVLDAIQTKPWPLTSSRKLREDAVGSAFSTR